MVKRLVIWLLVPLLLTSCQTKPSTSPTSIEQSTQSASGETSNQIPDLAAVSVKWDLETLLEIDKDSLQQITELEVLQGYEGGVIYLDFQPEGQMLASSGIDGSIRLWDLRNGTEIASIHHGLEGMGVSFHPTDHYLANCCQGSPSGNGL